MADSDTILFSHFGYRTHKRCKLYIACVSLIVCNSFGGRRWHPPSWATTLVTSPQSNLRRARHASADKTNSKLLGSHSPIMLTVRSRSCIWPPRSTPLSLLSQWMCCILFCYIFAYEFLFNPHFDLEPSYIIRKGIRHRIQRHTMHTEILPIFDTQVDYRSVCQSVCRHCKVLDQNAEQCQKRRQKQPLPLEACGLPSNT